MFCFLLGVHTKKKNVCLTKRFPLMTHHRHSSTVFVYNCLMVFFRCCIIYRLLFNSRFFGGARKTARPGGHKSATRRHTKSVIKRLISDDYESFICDLRVNNLLHFHLAREFILVAHANRDNTSNRYRGWCK